MGIKDNPNLYYTTPVYHMPIDNNGNAISEIEENKTVTPEKNQQVVSTFSDGAAVAQVTVEPIPDDYVNIADATLESGAQLLQGVIAYKRDGTRIEGTMSRSGGDIDPSYLNYDDTAVPGYYVSEVDEVNGIIDVKRAALPEIPTNVSDLNNDAGYISSASLPERVSAAGFATAASVDELAETASTAINTLDNEIDTLEGSIPTALSQLTNDTDFITNADLPIFAAVATSGDYNDLVSLPTIPNSTSDLINDSGFITLAEVPPISAADKAEIISEVEASIEPPTMDAATERRIIEQVTADLNIPDSTSDLTNDSGFITRNDIPSIPDSTSDLTNDSGFITSADIPSIPSKTSDLANDSGFITNAQIPVVPTTLSSFTNDVGFVTSAAIPDSTSDLTNDSGFITSADVPTTVAELSDATSYATKTYVDDAIAAIPGGGSSSGDIPTYNRQDSSVGGYLLYSGYSVDRASDSLYKSRDLSISNNSYSTTLYLGNATDGTQSQRGMLALQGNTAKTENYYNLVISAGLTANVTNTLPANSGILLNTGNTNVVQAQSDGVEIGTISFDQHNTTLYAPAALSNYTNDVGYVTASEVPSVGIMAIPISYNSSTNKYETTFTTADIQRLDFPIVSFENKYFYLDQIDTTNGAMIFYNFRAFIKRIPDSLYGFILTVEEDATTGEQTERIEAMIYPQSSSI